jgi:tetratricopeptide (TPR) repeat protein
MASLTLEADDVKDAQHWWWRLKDDKGKVLADHQVDLNRDDWQFQAFRDLYGYIKAQAAPGRLAETEKRIVDQVGAWIGEKVLGAVGPAILKNGTPTTVRVVVPGNSEVAKGLQYLPLELAYVDGEPLALKDVSLIFEVEGEGRPAPKPVGDRLRMLAVFSLPTGPGALNLRHERHKLRTMINSIAHRKGLAINLHVLQYGVTRKALEAILKDGEGWDVIHFSGHGLAAGLVLEKADGTQDLVSTEDVIKLLKPARGRLKWVTLSACLSAAAAVAETLRWLGLEPTRDAQVAKKFDAVPAPRLPAVAQSLVREIGCAVLAMRYPVGDEFAIGLGETLYQNVIEHRNSLPRALQMALPETSRSPLSSVTPALFGKQAFDLELKVPLDDPDYPRSRPSGGLAGFPDPPERFVGRVKPMIEAGKALAPEGEWTGVLFHGMSGAGKTSCAVELAHHYGDLDRFTGFVWYNAPTEGSEVAGSLARFATAFETQLSDENLEAAFKLVHVMAEEESKFDAYLPRLRKFLENRSVLIVLDNLETLLRPDGQWRDPRWGKLVATLLSHRGESRAVLTSRIRPILPAPPGVAGASSPQARLHEVPIHALTLDESALLARQLPNLGALLHGEGVTDDQERERHRLLVARMLNLVQGHPKLIELAEGQAADPSTLTGHLDRATIDWNAAKVGADRLGAFFREGESKLEADAFLQALAGWTTSIVATLPDQARTLFHFLACLEDDDRKSRILDSVWPSFWKRLSLAEDPPDLAATLSPLVASGLVEVQAIDPDEDPTSDGPRVYAIHPGVAESGRNEVGNAFRDAVDVDLSAFWCGVVSASVNFEMSGGCPFVVRGGLAAAPYLMRQQCWQDASALLERVVGRAQSPTTIAAVLPLLEHIAKAIEGAERPLKASIIATAIEGTEWSLNAAVLARALRLAGRLEEAEAILRSMIEEAVTRNDYRTASLAAGDLISLVRETGHSEQALDILAFKKEMARLANLDSPDQHDECQRLQLLAKLGSYEEVLVEVENFRSRMEHLRAVGDQEDEGISWNVGEQFLNAGQLAAIQLNRWELALELGAEIRSVQETRGALALSVAWNYSNDISPLLRLRRYNEARALIQHCRRVFEEEGDLLGLGVTFSVQAELEGYLGHSVQAVIHEQTALRFKYSTVEPDLCATGHFNLATYLIRSDGPSASSLAHRLAAVLIWHQTASGKLANALQALSRDLTSFDPAPVPSSFAELCQTVEQVEGVRFAELFAQLPTTRAATGDEALRKVLELARPEPEAPELTPELAQLLFSLSQAASAGQTDEVEALMLPIRQMWLQAGTGTEEQADAVIAGLREQLAGMGSAGAEPGATE